MCGILCYYGQTQGVTHILEALRLLEYRAPDSSGIAVIDEYGSYSVRRSVGPAQSLIEKITAKPLYYSENNNDPVQYAFRLVGAHIASRADLDSDLMGRLSYELQARVPEERYSNWKQAWTEEVRLKSPGQAFVVAVRHFQETFPGLSEHLKEDDWGRFEGLTAGAMSQIVIGHGRWAMVGAVTEDNAHPFLDRSKTRVVCENGSHNASLLLGVREEQERWWRERGYAETQPVHRSQNTTEVIVYEWERVAHQIRENELNNESVRFIDRLKAWEIDDLEESALRLTLQRLRSGNAHACAFHSRHHPGVLYVSSHNKPIAIIIKEVSCEESGEKRHEIMVASDVNAALVLWPDEQVETAIRQIEAKQIKGKKEPGGNDEATRNLQTILNQFSADVIFLDQNLNGGEELFARIENHIEDGKVLPRIRITRYDGTPVAVLPQRVQINPSMAGEHGFPSYTEFHIAEIPDVLDQIVEEYLRSGEIHLESVGAEDEIYSPGINVTRLKERFGSNLERLKRLVMIGEGSSWRDAQAAAPLFRGLLPDVLTVIYRPVEVLNLGETTDPETDLIFEISWSGTTDSILKTDSWLAEEDVLRVGITGRPQSDLGRRTAHSGGTLDVHSGVEVSVATVKGFEAILMTLNLTALYLAGISHRTASSGGLTRLVDELTLLIPEHVRSTIEDRERRDQIKQVARRCRHFNKVAIVGSSPIDIEAELKIEELAQILACPFDFHAPSLRSLIERSAIVTDDRQRTLFIINATSEESRKEANAVINYLNALGVFCIVHTIPGGYSDSWDSLENVEIFQSPQVSDVLQPLIDAPFFFDFAVALAYARGLSPREIDRPRNLAKSVTTTGAEKRSDVESRYEFVNIDLDENTQNRPGQAAWDEKLKKPSRAALQASTSLRSALAVLTETLPERLGLEADEHLILVTDTEATENAGQMARGAWIELFGLDITVFRRFLEEVPPTIEGTKLIHLIRAGAILKIQDSETIAFPADLSPLQLELLGTVYMIGLAVRLARERGMKVKAWEHGIARLPLIVSDILGNDNFSQRVSALLAPYIQNGYDKAQVIGGGQDFAAAGSIARSLRSRGFMAEALYTDSAWHGPLATVGGPDGEHDTLIIVLATDPLFQAAAMVDTQVYRTRNAPVLLVVPEGNQDLPAVKGVDASAILTVPSLSRPFVPIANVALGAVLAREMTHLWTAQFERGQI